MHGVRSFQRTCAVALAAISLACPKRGKLPQPAGVPFVRCEAKAPTGPSCVVRQGDGALVIRGTILAPNATYLRGAVIIIDGLVEDVGCVPAPSDAVVIDCGDSVVSPGLVNAHEHLKYNVPVAVDTRERYDHRHQWRLGKDGHTIIDVPRHDAREDVAGAELRHLLMGTTSIVGSGGVTGLVRNLDEPALLLADGDTAWLPVDSSTFPLGDAKGEAIDGATLPPTSTSAACLVAHLGEGIDERARQELSIAIAERCSVTLSVVHGVALTAQHARALARCGAGFVWSPRSNVSLYGTTAPVAMLLRYDVPVGLGTDWTTSGSSHLQLEAECAASMLRRQGVEATDRLLWEMMTSGAARAINMHRRIGTLAKGRSGDFAVFRRHEDGPHAAVVHAEPRDVLLVGVGGDIRYGEANVVQAVGTRDCMPVTVCGERRAACGNIPLVSLGMPQTQACEPQRMLPTCTPSRPGEYPIDGARNDSDEDGIDDTKDNCNDAFNPAQRDSDRDGRGDICDEAPLEGSR